jgi:colanic acid biosynthesis glycosyl transferase WcaI
MPDVLRAADVLVVHLRPSPIAEHAIPTKILAYLAAGRPVLCAAGGASAELIRAAEAGLLCEPGNAGKMAAAVRTLNVMTPEARDQLGRNGRTHLNRHYAKAIVIDSYERELAAVMREPGNAPADSRPRG